MGIRAGSCGAGHAWLEQNLGNFARKGQNLTAKTFTRFFYFWQSAEEKDRAVGKRSGRGCFVPSATFVPSASNPT
jgi:hypothetical protein